MLPAPVAAIRSSADAAAQTALYVASGVVVVLWVVTGILFLRAQGEPATLSKAKLALMTSIAGTVVVGIDEDGTMVKTLEKIKKSCQPLDKITFYRGGDRTISNMNNDEIKICNKLGIAIEYGVGDLLNSSSKIMARMSK